MREQEILKAIASNVRAETARAQLRHSDITEVAGISTGCVANRMTGKADWRILELVRLARYLGVPVERLVSV